MKTTLVEKRKITTIISKITNAENFVGSCQTKQKKHDGLKNLKVTIKLKEMIRENSPSESFFFLLHQPRSFTLVCNGCSPT